MKNLKLNRKGFTLVELLAVIVILAIVVGITLVTVLPTLDNAKEKAFKTAVDTIENYLQEQVDMKSIGSSFGGDSYVEEIANATCNSESNVCTSTVEGNDILDITGYSDNISAINWYVSNGKVTITCATAVANGDYDQAGFTACS